jgi:biopolymer transport protein ExbD
MAVKIQHGQALSALNLTPLIDVVFLLLIYFLVVSNVSDEERHLDIPLPSAANAQPMTAEPTEFVVNIDQQGTYVVNGSPLPLQELEKSIVRFVVDHPLNPAVIIRADRRVQLQSPVSVMDVCIKCGAAFSLTTDEEATP